MAEDDVLLPGAGSGDVDGAVVDAGNCERYLWRALGRCYYSPVYVLLVLWVITVFLVSFLFDVRLVFAIMDYLRRCRVCGLEAHIKGDLQLFRYSKSGRYNKDNFCKKCYNKYHRERLLSNDRSYLLRKLSGMKKRCYNPSSADYERYGERGITVCQEWLDDPEMFVVWSLSNGWKRGLTIERIDNDGPYSSGNCKWIPLGEQSSNQRMKKNAVTFPEKGTRICWKCKVEKPLTDFHRDRRTALGRRYQCKECFKK